jgi:hypothetical protein
MDSLRYFFTGIFLVSFDNGLKPVQARERTDLHLGARDLQFSFQFDHAT